MLFTPLTLRGVSFRNRICVSPMCQYSSEDGFATDWHLVHLGSRAVGGAALVFTEATAVTAQGRISARDLGLWKDEHVPGLQRIARFIAAQGAVPGLQLAHAGRKASVTSPWEGNQPVLEADGGWMIVAPSDIPFAQGYAAPRVLTGDGIRAIVQAFTDAARRALAAGFEVLEVHAAHGYLLHQFLSPLSNKRTDQYGGSLENRCRLALEVTAAVRAVWPERFPLFVRLSSTDWVEGGWDIEQSVELARMLKTRGADLVDCSSGGNVKDAEIPFGPGYQTAFAERVRRESGIATGAVGLITSAQQADHVLRTGQADMIIMARQLLRDPYWPLRAASELKAQASWPNQYLRARI